MNNIDRDIDKIQRDYLQALLKKDRKTAMALIEHTVTLGLPPMDIYISIFQKTQYQLGDMWMNGEISVAHEHFATAVTLSAMGVLAPHIFQGRTKGKRFLAFCVSRELHDIGLRMVTDCLALNGWDTIYLGANIPTAKIGDVIKEFKADCIGISVTMANHLDEAKRVISAVKATPENSHVKIIAGGYVFNMVKDLWKKIGAHACAKDAREALEIAEKVMEQP